MKADRDSTLERVRRSLEDFIAALKQVAPDRFLKPAVGEWSPRDVAAHIIGWLRLTIAGCEDLSRGVTPPYFADGKNDFANVNARLVGENPSRDCDELVRGLRTSFRRARLVRAAATAAGVGGPNRRPPHRPARHHLEQRCRPGPRH